MKTTEHGQHRETVILISTTASAEHTRQTDRQTERQRDSGNVLTRWRDVGWPWLTQCRAGRTRHQDTGPETAEPTTCRTQSTQTAPTAVDIADIGAHRWRGHDAHGLNTAVLTYSVTDRQTATT